MAIRGVTKVMAVRSLKMGFRVGDNAPMAYMELVDKAAPAVAEAKEEKAE